MSTTGVNSINYAFGKIDSIFIFFNGFDPYYNTSNLKVSSRILHNENYVSLIGNEQEASRKRDMPPVSEVKFLKYGFGKCLAVTIFSNEFVPNFNTSN